MLQAPAKETGKLNRNPLFDDSPRKSSSPKSPERVYDIYSFKDKNSRLGRSEMVFGKLGAL
jgi:hypothetical protein